MIYRILPSRQNIRRLICMYSEGSVWCFKCIVHSCKREWCRHNERERHMKESQTSLIWCHFQILGSSNWERGQERAGVCSPKALIFTLCPPRPLPSSSSSSSSSVTSQLCHLISLLRSHGTSLFSSPVRSDSSFHPLSSIVPSAPALSLSYTAGMFTFSQHQSLLFFSLLKKQ